MNPFKGRSLISIDDLSPDEVRHLMKKAAWAEEQIALRKRLVPPFACPENEYHMFASCFFEDSTRTRLSSEEALKRLGFSVSGFGSLEGTSVLEKGESLRHTLEMLRVMRAQGIVMRHNLDGAAQYVSEIMAKHNVGVVNGGDGMHEHPSQTLLDLFAILKKTGRLARNEYSLKGLNIILSGDLLYGRVPHSMVKSFGSHGVHFYFVAHDEFQMPKEYCRLVESLGSTYEQVSGLDEKILRNADFAVSLRFQTKRISDTSKLEKARRDCNFRAEHMQYVKPGFFLLHPLPINKYFPEIAPDLDDTVYQFYFNQAGGGVPTRMSIFGNFFLGWGDDFEGEPKVKNEVHDEFEFPRIITPKAVEYEYSILPIRDWGTVIDHLPVGIVPRLVKEFNLENHVWRGGNVRKRSDPSKVKGLLMVENWSPNPRERKVLAALSGDVKICGELTTWNDIREGKVAGKFDLRRPALIEGIGKCSNIVYDQKTGVPKGGCITRPEFNEHVLPRFRRLADNSYCCDFCDKPIDVGDLI